jgi:hypothetical protein
LVDYRRHTGGIYMQIEDSKTIARWMSKAAEGASMPMLGEIDLLEALGECEPQEIDESEIDESEAE